MRHSTRMGSVGTLLGAFGLALVALAPAASAQTDPQRRPGATAGAMDDPMERGSVQTPIQLVGQLQAASKDAAGKPTALVISDEKLGTYAIAADAKGRELMSHVGEFVTLIGRLELGAGGKRTLRVDRYELTKG